MIIFPKFLIFLRLRRKSDEKSGKGFGREWSQSTGFVELGASFQGKFFQGSHLDLEF